MTSRRRSRRTRGSACAGLALGLLTLLMAHGVWASFSRSSSSPANVLNAAADWVAPSASGSVIQKAEGGTPGYIRQGGGYRVFAQISDSGNPPGGVTSATSDVSTITTGQTAAALSAGTFTVGGQAYNYRGAALTAKSSLTAATYPYSLRLTDPALNARTQSGFSVVVDSVAPAGSALATADHTGGTAGRPEQGDSVTLTFTEPIEPNSVLAGWTGAATNVVVRIDNNSGSGSRDVLRIFNPTNTTALPLGAVNLGRNDYVTSNVTFGASGTPSTMTQSATTISITLGTSTSGARTAFGSGVMTWTPVAGVIDRAGNAINTSLVTESGGADREF